MAHKLQTTIPERAKKKKFSMPQFSGRFGFSFFLGSKEIFLGGMVSDVVLESVVRRRVVKTQKAVVRSFGFDPLEGGSN